jgi:hypothetical protein
MTMKTRKRALFAFATGVAVLGMASTAFACVTFKGQMTVDGHDGDTTVVGTGDSHAYCTQPTTAAAGHLTDTINVTVQPATCNGVDHHMENGTYLVKYNNEKSYTFDGTSWNMISGTGCFFTGNSDTVSDGNPAEFAVETVGGQDGHGSWTGTLGTLSGTPYVVQPGSNEAANFCVGAKNSTDTGRTGLLAPFQLLGV